MSYNSDTSHLHERNGYGARPALDYVRKPGPAGETLMQALARENSTLPPWDPTRKVWLSVPFKQKRDAMGLGAKFDNDRNRYYVTQEQAIALRDLEVSAMPTRRDPTLCLASLLSAAPSTVHLPLTAQNFAEWLPPNSLPLMPGEKRKEPPSWQRLTGDESPIGPDRASFQRMEEAKGTMPPAGLRALFAIEVQQVRLRSTLWLEFKDAMCGDASEELVVADIDQVLAREAPGMDLTLADFVDPTLLPTVPRWKVKKQRTAPAPTPPSAAGGGLPAAVSSQQPQAYWPAVAGPSGMAVPHHHPAAAASAAARAAATASPALSSTGRPLPLGWRSAIDPAHGREYYADPQGNVQWEFPEANGADQPLPPGWVEATDPRYNNRTYWYHAATRQTSWTRPTSYSAR